MTATDTVRWWIHRLHNASWI